MYTVLIFEGHIVRRAIGRFKSYEEAEKWAIKDGWPHECFRVVPFHD